MSQGLNRVMLIGNLGADPELRYTQGGQAILNMRLAVNETWRTKEGEKKERVEWVTVVMWGNRAEALSKHLSKGQSIYVEGRMQTRQWEDKEGNKRFTTEIVATDLLFLGGKSDGGQRQERTEQRREDLAGGGGDDDWGEDQIPFNRVDERLV